MLSSIEGCAEYEYQTVPYRSLLEDMGINVPNDLTCEVQVPICTRLSFGDAFQERLQYLAETFGNAYDEAESLFSRSRQLQASSAFGTRTCDQNKSPLRLRIPIRWSEMLFSALEEAVGQGNPLSLTKTKFSKLPFSDTKYLIHLMDVEVSSSIYIELLLEPPTGGTGWHFNLNFIADLKLSFGLPSTPKSILRSILTRSDPYHPSFEENGKKLHDEIIPWSTCFSLTLYQILFCCSIQKS